ncbi:MAG: glycoside hydrolase family 2 protein [Muribaculaceae bacterium]|nr:glycoside hydrolase family 2 protein [Muribaculaceae bacterium]
MINRQSLDGNWNFRESGKVVWHPGHVPGVVHTDLLSLGLIPDPFVGQNEREVQWVDKQDWIYERYFDLDQDLASADSLRLVFDGLDTYADVYLNDSLVLKADNMFRRWRVPVKNLVKNDSNKLTVYFHSPIKVDLPKFDALPFQYEAGNDQSHNGGIMDKRVSVFARKAGYHYGWDWGPRLVTIGIWRPVYLEGWSGPVIEDMYVTTEEISSKKSKMNAAVEIISGRDIPGGRLVLKNITDNKKIASIPVKLIKGLNKVNIPFDMKNPRLWWCNGMGESALYDFNVSLEIDGTVADEFHGRAGVRTVEVVRDEDAEGRSFYFKLNGVPVFAKGANYIPCDNFLPRVTDSIYARTVEDAVAANMNMLRVWGGGIYENDIFYNLCDSLGIMVWQDFMFACSLYPSEGDMLENIRHEAVDNVRRLRQHPSVVLWCGNNECLEAWYNWGLKRRYTAQGVNELLWKQYDDLYHKLLPDVVAECDPERFYWPSSPFSRVDGSPEGNRGDSHMWRVWGGSEPIDLYNDVRSRFFSEYGFQSFPDYDTVLKYAPDTTTHFIDSDVMLSHQRAGAGANRRIEKYLLDSYPQPRDFQSFLYLSQVLQGDAIRTAIEAHRRDRPYCMGSLFWQHNDCWPVASWSSRDYYGKWKAQHYFARKAYDDIMLSVRVLGDSVKVYVVSDKLKNINGDLTVNVIEMDGTPVGKATNPVVVKGNDVAMFQFSKSTLVNGADEKGLCIYTTLTTPGKTYDNIFLPLSPREMVFTQPGIKWIVTELSDGKYEISLNSENFARAVYMTLPGEEKYFFSDNFFDMLPGRTYTVQLATTVPLEKVKERLAITSLYDATLR